MTVSQSKHERLGRFPFPRVDPLSPPPAYTDLQARAGLTRVALFDDTEAWLATRYEDVRTVLRDPNVSADTTKAGYPFPSPTTAATKSRDRGMNRMDPPRHDELRRMVAASFRVSEILKLRPIVESIVDRLLSEMEHSGAPVDLVDAFAEPVPARLTTHLMGVPDDQIGFFLERIHTWMSFKTPPAEATAAATDMQRFFEQLIDKRAELPTDDLVGRLVSQHYLSGSITRSELMHMLLLLLIGGFDTTAHMIALGTLTFCRYPEERRKLISDPSLVPGAVEELLRYLTVAHYAGFRIATADVHVGGRCLHAGEGIAALMAAANRDAAVFEDPNRFDVCRDARRHLAFGDGVHMCLGHHLARLELCVVFERLFARFPALDLAVPFESLVFSDSLIYGVESLPVTW